MSNLSLARALIGSLALLVGVLVTPTTLAAVAALHVSVAGQGVVLSNPVGVGCPADCDQEFQIGTVVSLTAVPKSGRQFIGWGGACSGSRQVVSVTLDAARQCTALFRGLSRLHVEGRRLISAKGDAIDLRAINFDHYMEYGYEMNSPNPPTASAFVTRLGWTHTADDYQRVKRMGFNAVRLNISPGHVNVPGAFEDLARQVAAAKAVGLYLIIGYFTPPGSTAADGYYDESSFWNQLRLDAAGNLNTGSSALQKFAADWMKISTRFRGEDHLIYELLNEPQIMTWQQLAQFDKGAQNAFQAATWMERVYLGLMRHVIGNLRSAGDDHVIMVDGLDFASVDPRTFRFVSDLRGFDANLIYSFHFYQPEDYAWQQCYWGLNCEPYVNTPDRFTTTEPGWQTVAIPFNTNEMSTSGGAALFTPDPQVVFGTYRYPGTIYLRSLQVVDSSGTVVLSQDFRTKQVLQESSSSTQSKIIGDSTANGWRNCWLANFNNIWGSAVGSDVGLRVVDGEQVLSISSTMNKNATLSATGREEPYAMVNHIDESWCPRSVTTALQPNANYTLRLQLRGERLTHYGGLFVKLQHDYSTPVLDTTLYRFAHVPDGQVGKDASQPANTRFMKMRVSSDLDMIRADFDTLRAAIDAPLFLGEFGVPIRNPDAANAELYFNTIANEAEAREIGWSLFLYREIMGIGPGCTYYNSLGAGAIDCGRMRTLGLYSGWGSTVSDMEPSLGTDVDNSNSYYRRDFIAQVARRLVGEAPYYDLDRDGLPLVADSDPLRANTGTPDLDNDGVSNATDSAPLDADNRGLVARLSSTEETTVHGWGAGTEGRHYTVMAATFRNNGSDRLLHVQGFDVDHPNEVAVFVNGKRFGYITRGRDNAFGAKEIFYVREQQQVAGLNRVEFRQTGQAGETWGVRGLAIYPIGRAFGNLRSLPEGDRSHPGGLRLHLPKVPAAGWRLALRPFDADTPDEIAVAQGGSILAYLPVTGNRSFGTAYSLNLSAAALSPSNNVVLRIYDTLLLSEEWGVRIGPLR